MFTGEHFGVINERGLYMKKKFVSFAVLALFFAFCANSGECKTVNYNYNVPPQPHHQVNRTVLPPVYNQYNSPYYSKTGYYKHKPIKKVYKNNNRNYKIANRYGYTPYNYNQYTYKQPSIWQRIFNI